MVSKTKKFEATVPPAVPKCDRSSCTFYMKTIQGGAIRTLCDVLKDIVHDVTLRIDKSGVKCTSMEGSKTCFINLHLHADRFDEFHCNLPTYVSLGMQELSVLVGCCEQNDQLSLYQERSETDVMVVHIDGQAQESIIKKIWKLKLKALDVHDIDMDQTEYHSIITMESSFFHGICRLCSKLSDALVIESLSERLRMGVEGPWACGAYEVGQGKNCSFISKSEKEYRSVYALRFLNLFCKASGLSRSVEMYLAEDYPLQLKYLVSDLGELYLSLAALVDLEGDADMQDDETF